MMSPMPPARLVDVGCEDGMVQRPVVVHMDLYVEVAGSAAPCVAVERTQRWRGHWTGGKMHWQSWVRSGTRGARCWWRSCAS